MKSYLLIAGDWSLKVGIEKQNPEMTDELKGHKIIGGLNPNESIYLRELTHSKVPQWHILTKGTKVQLQLLATIFIMHVIGIGRLLRVRE